LWSGSSIRLGEVPLPGRRQTARTGRLCHVPAER
jgi:hypothetical protein